MISNAWTNNRRTTIDEYEFQELCGGKWEYSHTDVGRNVMLANKRAYEDNQRRGGNPFRIVKRRVAKSEYTAEQHKRYEIADLTALIERMKRLNQERPDSKRKRNREFQIERAEKRIAQLS